MLVLRLLVMVLTIICLMDGHAEVSSSTTGIRDRTESPAVKTNEQEVQIHDRKKKKKPKPSKKKKTKPGKKKKPNKAKPTPTKPVTTTPTVSTSTLKTTKILTTPPITTTTTTVSPTTTATTAKTTHSTASATTTLSTSTSATTTVATSSTVSTATTTIPTTATTSSLPTTAATTADSGAGEECKATNGKPCIFPFKDGKEYNECKNEGGKYFWCATSVYDSGKYKHWSYCPEDRSCPLEGDGECRAENNKPCVFPFKDGVKEYNECADHGGQYFWCATGTNSAGKYTAWSKCPKDGSCPLPQKSSTPVITPTATAAITSSLTTGTTMPPMEKQVFSSLKDLVKEESKNDTFKMLETMNEEMQAINEDLEGQRNIESGGNATIFKKHSVGDEQDGDLIELRSYGENSEFTWSTFTYKGPTYLMGESNCCSACKKKWSDTVFFEYWPYFKKCWCYKEGSYGEPGIKHHNSISTGKCVSQTGSKCLLTRAGAEPCLRSHKDGYTRPGAFISGPKRDFYTDLSANLIEERWTVADVNSQTECNDECNFLRNCIAYHYADCRKNFPGTAIQTTTNCLLLIKQPTPVTVYTQTDVTQYEAMDFNLCLKAYCLKTTAGAIASQQKHVCNPAVCYDDASLINFAQTAKRNHRGENNPDILIYDYQTMPHFKNWKQGNRSPEIVCHMEDRAPIYKCFDAHLPGTYCQPAFGSARPAICYYGESTGHLFYDQCVKF